MHLYTASSAVFGVWAVVAIFSHELRLALYLMLLALAIDSTDGALARVVDVRRRIPWIDGRRLDDICDFFNYVLVPACFLVAADLLPHPARGSIGADRSFEQVLHIQLPAELLHPGVAALVAQSARAGDHTTGLRRRDRARPATFDLDRQRC